MTARRYPLEPLFDAMHLTPAAACRLLRVSGSVEQEYRRRGVTEVVADRLAARAHLATYAVWPEMIDHAIEDAETNRLARQAARARHRYETDAEYRARRLAGARAYKEATRRAQAAYNARYRAENRDRIAARQRAHYQENRDRILARQRAYDRGRAAGRNDETEEVA